MDITKALQGAKGEINEDKLAVVRIEMAADYSYWSGLLENSLEEKYKVWEEFRKDKTSDTQAERAWQKTEQGRIEVTARIRLKNLEKAMSVIKSRIDIIVEGKKRTI